MGGARYNLEALVNYHCAIGENPLWDDAREMVYWSDIPQGRLFRYHVPTGEHEQFYEGEPVGGFTLQEDGSLLLFGANRAWRLGQDGALLALLGDIDEHMSRFNDVIADPQGRVFAGTIAPDGESGGLFRVELDGSVSLLFRGTGISNGMGFSPDLRHFYWTDTTARRIFRFAYDYASGALSDRHELIAVPAGEGTPDGMTVDSEGCLWSARWDGYAVYRFSPAGEQIDRIEFPVPKVSSVIFGGPELDALYVTTAGGQEGADTAEGTLYRVQVAARGLPEFRSRLMLA